MGEKFKGKNDNDTLVAQVNHRATYSIGAFEKLFETKKIHESVTDFNFSEMVYYGRIDDELDPVVPLSDSLAALGGGQPGDIHIILTTIKKMFQDFKSKFAAAVRIGNIPGGDPFLSEIKIYKAYENPVSRYETYMKTIVSTFNEGYLRIPENRNNVMNFDDYVRHFIILVEVLGETFPATLTGFQKSNKSNIFTSGLAISISDLDCSNDTKKEQYFLDNKCMDFYLNAAKQYGFSVMKNVPWILIADLDSVSTKLYTGINARETFRYHYRKTYTLDLNLLPDMLRKGYNEFVSAFAYKKELIICKDNTIGSNIYRETLNNNIFNSKYTLKYWIPLYIRIRNIEDGKPYSEQAVFRMIQKAISFQKLLDNEQAMRYINEQYRVKYKFADGGFLYYHERFKKKKEGE